jgi:replicative DNA helicase
MQPNEPKRTRSLLDDETIRVEAAVVGACIVRPHFLRECELETNDLSDYRHQVVWMALRTLTERGEPIDTLTLELEIAKAGKLDAVGGPAFLGALALSYPTEDNFAEYSRQVADRSLCRRIALAAGDLVELAVGTKISGEDLLDEAHRKLGAMVSRQAEIVEGIGTHVQRRLLEVERVAQSVGELTGAPTGVELLDAKIGGWQFGVVNMIAARPGMGKSALGISTADACSKAGLGVHVFSLEDSERAYSDRVLARSSGVPAIRGCWSRACITCCAARAG